ncbi:MAG: M20/M25/M40 family metallo-hydrolase [Bacteroidetes bacterium]|nr:M20/M25/M40 family metallo-hydrolase [Bacteroidota bacterium]
MKKYSCALTLSLLLIGITNSQEIIRRDPEIESMIRQISPQRLEQHILKLVSFHTRHNMSEQNSADKGIGAAWNWILKEFESYVPASGGRLKVEFDEYKTGGERQRIPQEITLKNVIATLQGSDPADTRIIVMSAHLDSRAARDIDNTNAAPGANDDASGIAAMLEICRIISAKPFPATIVFMAFSGEEHGLLGARHTAQKAKDENWNIIALLNNDMIANSDAGETLANSNMRLRVFSEGVPALETDAMASLRRYTSGENDGKARQLARYIKEIGERYVDQLDVTLIFRNDRFGRGGDHTPFCQLGFTAVRISEFNENYDRQHQVPRTEDGKVYGDLPEFIDYEYLRKNTGVNLAVLANLAQAPWEPVNCGIRMSGTGNHTTIGWEPPKQGKKPAGYYVMMRETYMPLWQKKIFVTGTEITLPYSKDNYFFAVQSVDENGHESLPVFPGQMRR